MNVITNINSRVEARKQIIEDLGPMPDDVTFDTYTKSMHYGILGGFKEYPKKVFLMNSMTNQPISIVGKNYKNTTTHGNQFKYMEEMIANSNLDLEGLTREISVSHGGGRAYARYRLPAHTVQTGEGDETVMELVGRNSFDGSWPSIFELGAWRLICTNLQVIGTVTAVAKRRHTKHSNIEGAVVELGNCLEAFLKEGETWNTYRTMPVTDTEAYQVLALLSENKYAIGQIDEAVRINSDNFVLNTVHDATHTKNFHPRKKSSLRTLWNLYKQDYAPSLGNNVLALYNTMTDWSTHHQTASKNTRHSVSSLQIQAGEKVRKIIQTQPIFRLAA